MAGKTSKRGGGVPLTEESGAVLYDAARIRHDLDAKAGKR